MPARLRVQSGVFQAGQHRNAAASNYNHNHHDHKRRSKNMREETYLRNAKVEKTVQVGSQTAELNRGSGPAASKVSS